MASCHTQGLNIQSCLTYDEASATLPPLRVPFFEPSCPPRHFRRSATSLPPPKRFSELRGIPSSFPQDTNFPFDTKACCAISLPLTNVGTSSPSFSSSHSVQRSWGIDLKLGGWPLFAGELNQSTLVEPGAIFPGKADVAVEVEVVHTGEGGLLEVLWEVDVVEG